MRAELLNSTMSNVQHEILSLSNKIREDPMHTNDEQNKLIRYLQSNDLEVSAPAAMQISSLSKDYPETICDKSAELAEIFISSEAPPLRLELAKLFKNLAESGDCMNKSVVKGVTEATRIRSDKYWEMDTRKEESTIRYGIEGWLAILHKSNYEIPREVTESIAAGIPVFERRTVFKGIELFKAVCMSGGEGEDLAFRYLILMTNSDNINVSLRAMEALAELWLEEKVSNQNAIEECFKSNYRTREETVEKIEEALTDIHDQ